MRSMLSLAKKLYRDEQGSQGLELLLIIAAIVLPLLGLLIVFRQKIGQWASDTWNSITADANQPVPTP